MDGWSIHSIVGRASPYVVLRMGVGKIGADIYLGRVREGACGFVRMAEAARRPMVLDQIRIADYWSGPDQSNGPNRPDQSEVSVNSPGPIQGQWTIGRLGKR